MSAAFILASTKASSGLPAPDTSATGHAASPVSKTVPIDIFLRIRPCRNNQCSNTIDIVDEFTIQTNPPQNSNAFKAARGHDSGSMMYLFDGVFGPHSTQNDVYERVALPLVEGLFTGNDVSGQSALLFNMGATGTGKTYTSLGTGFGANEMNMNNDSGILPRALKDILRRIPNDDLQVHLSCLQIHNNVISDLLPGEPNPQSSKSDASLRYPLHRMRGPPHHHAHLERSARLKLRENTNGEFFVENLARHAIDNIEKGLELLQRASANRRTSNNKVNQASSRSHVMFKLEITAKTSSRPNNLNRSVSELWIVDLAGNERNKKTESRGPQQKEGSDINTSIMILMECLRGVSERCREHNLTKIFKGRLHGPAASKMSLIVNVSPTVEDYDETKSSLKHAFDASKAKTVRTSFLSSAFKRISPKRAKARQEKPRRRQPIDP